jgi:hypothetical protein
MPLDYGSGVAWGTDMPPPIPPPASADRDDVNADAPAEQPMSILQQLLPPCFTEEHATSWTPAAYDKFDTSAIREPGDAIRATGRQLRGAD